MPGVSTNCKQFPMKHIIVPFLCQLTDKYGGCDYEDILYVMWQMPQPTKDNNKETMQMIGYF